MQHMRELDALVKQETQMSLLIIPCHMNLMTVLLWICRKLMLNFPDCDMSVSVTVKKRKEKEKDTCRVQKTWKRLGNITSYFSAVGNLFPGFNKKKKNFPCLCGTISKISCAVTSYHFNCLSPPSYYPYYHIRASRLHFSLLLPLSQYIEYFGRKVQILHQHESLFCRFICHLINILDCWHCLMANSHL